MKLFIATIILFLPFLAVIIGIFSYSPALTITGLVTFIITGYAFYKYAEYEASNNSQFLKSYNSPNTQQTSSSWKE